ncbi:hypothetical protein [Nocardia goodfellowii]|uniref:Thioredoxin n=1 Tax=Nocardia goodfellowii TaxID=882446 RepID=A0ABS4QES0_9NOCA|nr:hypothetical protein [Nocardia goodfellowii]MBP2190185.1 hypothetical protein [Nocardia goodfellowii]
MSDEQATPEVADLGEIPATLIRPDDAATLSLRYVEGVPTLVVTGGAAVPEIITAVDDSGTPVVQYTASPVTSARASHNFVYGGPEPQTR